MSKAEELLDSLTAVEHEHEVEAKEVTFEINPEDKSISNVTEKILKLNQGEHKSTKFVFNMPRYINGHDMMLCNMVYIPYINAEPDSRTQKFRKGVCTVADMQLVNEDTIKFTWLVTRNSTYYAGGLSFMVIFQCMEGERILYSWNAEPNSDVVITAKLDSGETFEYEYIDIIEQWKSSVKAEFTKYLELGLDERAVFVKDRVKEELTQYLDGEIERQDDNIGSAVAIMNDTLNTFDDILKTEITNMDSDIDVLKARMDTFTKLEEGSTTGDAELVDARIGYDGYIYNSAGTATRDQIKQISDDMQECFIFETGVNEYNPKRAKAGQIMQHTGNIATDPAYALTDYIHVPYGYSVMATCDQASGGRGTTISDGTSRIIKSVCVFEEDKQTVIEDQGSSSQVGWYANYITKTDKWVRISFKPAVTPNLMIEILPIVNGSTTGEPSDYQTSLTAVGIQEYKPYFIKKTLNPVCDTPSWYFGKKIAVLGDSITELETWQPHIASYFGCEMVNCGVGGSRIANYPAGERNDYMCGDTRIDAIPEDSDMIIVFGGHNDFSTTCPIGEFTQWWTLTDSVSGEFIPAYALLIKKLINRFPGVRIIIMTCVGGRTSEEDKNQDGNFYLRGYQMADYSDAIKSISRYFGIPCIDVGGESGINVLNHTSYIADVIHPNAEGGKLIANAVINGMKRFEPIDL